MRILSVTRLLALIVVSLPLVTTISSSQGFVNAKYAGEFLSLGAGARSAGVGGAGVAISNDVTAGYYNPASLSAITYPQIALFHESRLGGLFNYDYLAGALPLDARQTVGLSVLRLDNGEIQDTRNALIDENGNGILEEGDRIDPTRIRIGGASDWAFIGSYSRTISPTLTVGGNLKVLYRTILDTSAWGIGVDLGARLTPVNNLVLGATLQDVTKSLLTWETGHQEFIVPSLKLGGAYRLPLGADHAVTPTVDGIFRFEGRSESAQVDLGVASLDVAAGLEYGFKDRLYARGGYSEIGQLSLGAGVKLPKLNIDYAFTQESSDLDNVGATHRVSLMLTLSEEKFARPTE